MPASSALLAALSPANVLACLIGVFVGTIVGVLPGLGPVTTMALILPLTFYLPTETSLIMLAGIYYGSMYGGSTTSILLNVPGETASVVTCLDGYPMSQKGRGGAALALSAIGSFVAGTLGILGLTLIAPPLASFALSFGPPEYFAIGLFGLIVLSNLTEGDPFKNWAMLITGLILGTLGMDAMSGHVRYDLGIEAIDSGIPLVPTTMGLFGIAEVLRLLDKPEGGACLPPIRLKELYPNRQEMKRALPAMFRGGILGFFVGLIPGPAAVLAAFMAYIVEKKVSKHPEEFGHGAVEGVAGPESANNAACSGTMVPLVTLGFPFGPAAAMLLAGFMIHGVRPGPLFITQQRELFFTLIASMYIGNIFLLIFNLPLVGVFSQICRIPSKYLAPIIVSICIVGAYGDANNLYGVVIMIVAGVIGYLMNRFGYSPAPLIVGLVVSNMMENALRQTLMIRQGDLGSLLSRPIFMTLMIASVLVLLIPGIRQRLLRPKALLPAPGLVPK